MKPEWSELDNEIKQFIAEINRVFKGQSLTAYHDNNRIFRSSNDCHPEHMVTPVLESKHMTYNEMKKKYR